MDEMMQLGDLTKIATYEEFDRAFENESRRVSQGFIRMGYLLRRARDTDILYHSGYKSIAEYAEKKYGFKPDYVSNLIKVNEKYSKNGYSDRIQERYGSWGFSLLVELADLPEEIAEEIPDGIKREEIREVKREIKAEERITPIEAALEEEAVITRIWDSLLSKFIVQHYRNNHEAFPEAWRTMRKTRDRDAKKVVMDIFAPSGICTKMARIQGVGKYMLSIKDEATPPMFINVRTTEKTAVGWEEIYDALDEIFNNPLDSTYQDTWKELYGEMFPGEERDERSVSDVTDVGEIKPAPEEKRAEETRKEQPEPPHTLENDRRRGVAAEPPGAEESLAEGVGRDVEPDGRYAEGVEDEKQEGGEAGEPAGGFETEEIAPAQIMNPPETGEARQTTVEDFPEILPEGYIPMEEQKTDEVTKLWDRARTLVGAMQSWMENYSYGVGPRTKKGLDDIMNAASELQEITLELKDRL